MLYVGNRARLEVKSTTKRNQHDYIQPQQQKLKKANALLCYPENNIE